MSAALDAFVSRLGASPSAYDGARATREDDATVTRAAVAAIVRDRLGAPELLFIKRADRPSDPWSGHMAFPGGRSEKTDATLLATATRETREEIGVDLERDARVIARLPDVMPYSRMPSQLTVTAFVFALDASFDEASLAPNEEVARVVWASLDDVLRNHPATKFRWSRSGVDLVLPALDVKGEVVWGLTYRMLELLREAVG